MNNGTSEQNIETETGVLIVTQEQYEEMKAAGIDDETLLPPGSYKLRRRNRTATKEEPQSSNVKVDVTLKLDADVLDYFKERANGAAADAASYQTQINQELRQIMERDRKLKSDENIENRLLQNKNFIAALAAELKKVA